MGRGDEGRVAWPHARGIALVVAAALAMSTLQACSWATVVAPSAKRPASEAPRCTSSSLAAVPVVVDVLLGLGSTAYGAWLAGRVAPAVSAFGDRDEANQVSALGVAFVALGVVFFKSAVDGGTRARRCLRVLRRHQYWREHVLAGLGYPRSASRVWGDAENIATSDAQLIVVATVVALPADATTRYGRKRGRCTIRVGQVLRQTTRPIAPGALLETECMASATGEQPRTGNRLIFFLREDKSRQHPRAIWKSTGLPIRAMRADVARLQDMR